MGSNYSPTILWVEKRLDDVDWAPVIPLEATRHSLLPVSGVQVPPPISQMLNNDIHSVSVAQFDVSRCQIATQAQNEREWRRSCDIVTIIHSHCCSFDETMQQLWGRTNVARLDLLQKLEKRKLPQNIFFVFFFFHPRWYDYCQERKWEWKNESTPFHTALWKTVRERYSACMHFVKPPDYALSWGVFFYLR